MTPSPKPISQKQLAANRANARKSTGPNSPKGRAISRLNAVRDGLTGQVISLSPEERPIFEKLEAEHIANLNPQTLEEHKLAQSIAWDTWLLDRLRATEMNIYALGVAEAEANAEAETECEAAGNQQADTAFTDVSTAAPNRELTASIASADTYRDKAARFELMSLYEQRLTRSLYRNRAALRELREERQRKYQQDRQEEILLARFEDLKDLPYQAAGAPTPNGFVFSSDEINAAAQRERNLEACIYLLNNKMPRGKYGSTGADSPDLFANIPCHRPPDRILPKSTASPPNPSPCAGTTIPRSAKRRNAEGFPLSACICGA